MKAIEIIEIITFLLILFRVFDLQIKRKRDITYFDSLQEMQSNLDMTREWLEEANSKRRKLEHSNYLLRKRLQNQKK